MGPEDELYQQQLKSALNNFGYRLFSFFPYTKQLTNVFDILGMSPDATQHQVQDIADGSGLTAGVLNNKTKVRPKGPGTLHRKIAENKARVWKKALRPLNAIDVAGDAKQLYDDYTILNNAARRTNGVYKSGIIINPYEYH